MKKIYDLYNGKYDIAELSVDVTMAGQTNEQGKIELQGRFPEKKLLFFWILSKLPSPSPVSNTIWGGFCS